ncbi:MgtC/SapB family protein [Leptothermofonsia sichuanensis]|uniref:MgtC/SapB family protein n=1 Tax=Leptothermofonsia sichuanensis TaxID=2917832 RepID=UPI001CEDEFC1|nr:MgtC/SapB family protein [Leptothermofonsia sichuanensis]
MAIFVSAIWFNPGDWVTLTFRLVLATLVGGIIGFNREMTGKAAGLRTHMLVSLGAALFVIVTLTGSSTEMDAVSRAIQGVATGVGFLGAGEIIQLSEFSRDKPRIKGLTSAASIWATAALGIVAACGLWQIGLIGTLLVLLTLSGAKGLERFISLRREDDER